MSLVCPSCGSESTQKLSLVYSSGTASSSSTTIGVGSTGHGVGVGAAITSGMSQSQLASKYGPPKRNEALGSVGILITGIILCGPVGALFDSELVAWAVIAGGFIFGFANGAKAYRYNRTELPHLYTQWEKKLLCLRCGDVFTPAPPPSLTSQLAPSAKNSESQTMFHVRLMSAGVSPISTMKAIHDVTGCGLAEAKKLVDSAPSIIKTFRLWDEAQVLEKQLTEKGAHVVVREISLS